VVKYLVKKIVYSFLVLFGVITSIFFLFNAKPGDPALMAGGQNATEEVIENIKHDLGLDLPLGQRYLLYLNDLSPFSIHNNVNDDSHVYLDTAKYKGYELFSVGGDKVLMFKWPYLRRSYHTKRSVGEIIEEKLPMTAILAVTAILLATIIGIVMGVISAVNKGTFYDNASFIVAVAGMSAPSFFMAAIISVVGGVTWAETLHLPVFPFIGLILAVLVGFIKFLPNKYKGEEKFWFNWKYLVDWAVKGFFIGLGIWAVYIIGFSIFNYGEIPIVGSTMPLPGTSLNPSGSLIGIDDYTGEEVYNWSNLVLPTITLGIRPLAIVTQLTRSSMLDVLSQDYIRTAKAKGLRFWQIIVKHAMKNALNPVITALSGWFASLLAGSVFVEKVFDWDGIGNVLLGALQNDDLPLVMGIVVVVSVLFVVINIFVDIAYGYLDPRVRVK